MAKYKLKLTLTSGSVVTTTNAIEIPAKVVSAEFVAEVANITFTITNGSGGPNYGTLTFEVPGDLSWDDLANNGAKDSTNNYTLTHSGSNISLNGVAQYAVSTASNRMYTVSGSSPTDGTTYYYVNPAALN